MKRFVVVVFVGCVTLVACSSDDEGADPTNAEVTVAATDPIVVQTTEDAAEGADTTAASEPEGRYVAEIRRTSDGVAHITASDWGSLGFGQGHAFAQDRACTLIDQVVKVRGERSKWFGPGDDDENLNSDFAYRHLGLLEEVPERWADPSERVGEVIDGYIAGFNHELDASTAGSWCAGEPWVQPITPDDLYAYIGDVLLLASSRNLIEPIATAQPPVAASEQVIEPETSVQGLRSLADQTGASNGWALGADRSAGGGGLLLANPHFPWEGELRFWESHLTIPGEVDVYGVALSGLPGVQIGFNDAIAWTHTVSSGQRFTVYRYDLDTAQPVRYIVDGESRPMEPKDITIEVAAADGTTTEVSRTLWSTEHGPVLNLDPLGWTSQQALAIGDTNAVITSVLDQYLAMDSATSMDEFQAAHEEFQGVPWVNTIATSADGRAWYADTSATPNLSPEATAAWLTEREAEGLIGLAYSEFGIVLLNGSASLFNWVDDPAAPAPGLLPFDQLPQIERSDYVFNANDSYWLANPSEPLDGFSPLQGEVRTPISPRSRMNGILLGESDEPWTITDVQEAIFSNRSVLAELLLDDVVAACTASPTVDVDGRPVDLGAACAALSTWDGTYDLDAEGAMVWREFLARFSYDDLTDAGRLFSDGFDPADPIGTPSVPSGNTADWLTELGRAVLFMESLGVPVDAPLGDWQWEVRTGERIPIHGGDGFEGIANAVGCCSGSGTRQPIADNGMFPDEFGYLTDLPGYPVSQGASFVMALEFGADGPIAEGFLTYGNPDDPDDPLYSQGLRDFSAKQWRTFAFTDEAIDADPDVEAITVTGS